MWCSAHFQVVCWGDTDWGGDCDDLVLHELAVVYSTATAFAAVVEVLPTPREPAPHSMSTSL